MMQTVPSVGVSPIPQQERIALLDILRGVSIIGIALINILFFTIPILRLLTWEWSDVRFSEGLVRAGLTFFVERQFLSIFSILFGMGIAFQYERARQTGQRFLGVAIRRLLILLTIGIAHGLLLWYGDILALYALLGFVALGLRNRSPRTLLIIGLISFMVPVLMQALIALSDPYAQTKSLDELKDSLVAELQKQEKSTSSGLATSNVTSDSAAATSGGSVDAKQNATAAKNLVAWVNFLADDQRCYRSGTYGQMVLHRAFFFAVFSPLVGLMDLSWRALGLILLGMYMFRRGYFWEAHLSWQSYQRLAVWSMIPGIILQTVGLFLQASDDRRIWCTSLQFVCVYLGSFGMSLGYMGILALLYQYVSWKKVFHPLVAVGQMSLTNYIGTSFLFGLIFYGYGLGLMGRVSPPIAQLIALAVLTVLTAFSVFWLKYFQYGPLEWGWRVLTYLRFLPILRQRRA